MMRVTARPQRTPELVGHYIRAGVCINCRGANRCLWRQRRQARRRLQELSGSDQAPRVEWREIRIIPMSWQATGFAGRLAPISRAAAWSKGVFAVDTAPTPMLQSRVIW